MAAAANQMPNICVGDSHDEERRHIFFAPKNHQGAINHLRGPHSPQLMNKNVKISRD